MIVGHLQLAHRRGPNPGLITSGLPNAKRLENLHSLGEPSFGKPPPYEFKFEAKSEDDSSALVKEN